MKYPNRIQAAVLLDARFEDLDAVARDFARICELKSGAALTLAEHHPNRFMRLTGTADPLTASFEYVNAPPAGDALKGALNSPVTALLSPGLAERVASAPAHILLEVSHGALPASQEATAPSSLTAGLEAPTTQSLHASQANSDTAPSATPSDDPGAQAFHRRLDTLSLMVRMTNDHCAPCAIHWTQSDQLLDPETFEGMAAIGFPGPLAIHPRLFGVQGLDDDDAEIGIHTFGAAHWLGRELRVPPSPVPWSAAYETLLAFCELASMEGGYVIPDGDTFGPEDGSEVWRVHHREPEGEPGDDEASPQQALYELVPLRHDACQFIAEDFARSSSVLCVREPKAQSKAQSHAQSTAPSHVQSTVTPDAANGSCERALEETEEAEEASLLAEMKAALAEGRAEAAANPPEPLSPVSAAGTPSLAGDATVSGRSLRAQVFGSKEA